MDDMYKNTVLKDVLTLKVEISIALRTNPVPVAVTAMYR